MVHQGKDVMRAERDEDEYRPLPRKKERRLAYEIAIGVFIAQVLFWPIERVADYYYSKWQMGVLKVEFDQWQKAGMRGLPLNR